MRHEKITTSVKQEREDANRNAALDKLRADIDYLGMMSDVDFGEDESEDMDNEQEV